MFIRFQMQEAVENHGPEELKSSWQSCENFLIRERRKEKRTKFNHQDLHEFLENVKTRFHSHISQTKAQPRRQGGATDKNRVRRAYNNNNTNNGTNQNAPRKICAYFNMRYGCNKKECSFDHAVIQNEQERRKLIDIATGKTRCNVCGVSSHKSTDCKLVEKMKEVLKEQKNENKVKRTTKKDKEESKYGDPDDIDE